MEMDPDSEELIGRLLAADDPYFFEEADGACVDDAEDSDYVETPARKKPRTRTLHFDIIGCKCIS